MDNQPLETIPEESIYDFINLQGLRRYLIDCPNMLLMFEILINHIDYSILIPSSSIKFF